jgi:glycosyltransferase involved in cell wall biosynthesis
VEFFALRILPEVRGLLPDVKFVVGGRNPPGWLRRRFAGIAGVEFTGTVPDMRAEIAKATVCVVPLRIGSGTRLKILEAAAMAKPIVSTRLGAEGLDFVDGREIVLADDPKAFAGAVAELLSDASRRRQLGQAARTRVEECYGVPALRAAVRAAFAQLSNRFHS